VIGSGLPVRPSRTSIGRSSGTRLSRTNSRTVAVRITAVVLVA
jgi:hypothetical protein